MKRMNRVLVVVAGAAALGGCPYDVDSLRDHARGPRVDARAARGEPDTAVAPQLEGDASAVDAGGCETAGQGCDCRSGEARSCGEAGSVGACAEGVQECAEGQWGPCSIDPATESCNDIDDDCDGYVDETPDGEADHGLKTRCWPDPDDDGYAAAESEAERHCGECPEQSTATEPAGSKSTDCKPGNGDIHPGATEVCNRIDDDCSSGGGDAVEEDYDNDGQAPTYADCDGGIPKTDCNDFDERALRAEVAWHTARGKCDPRKEAHATRCDFGWMCLEAGVTCEDAFSMSQDKQARLRTNGYDFNCDGVETHRYEPAASSIPEHECNSDGVSWPCSEYPAEYDLTRGYIYDGRENKCGKTVTYFDCDCGSLPIDWRFCGCFGYSTQPKSVRMECR